MVKMACKEYSMGIAKKVWKQVPKLENNKTIFSCGPHMQGCCTISLYLAAYLTVDPRVVA